MVMEKWVNQYICLKKDIDVKDFEDINNLEKLCTEREKVNLKLELEYKLSIRKEKSSPLKAVNEFLYYADNTLIGYLGISNFGSTAAEINGMVHPDLRRQGIFTRLYELAKDECRRREFKKMLLLSDERSESGKRLIESLYGKYSFSEYKMKLKGIKEFDKDISVNLRKAKNSDGEEIARLNSIFFGEPNIQLTYPEEEEKHNQITYMIELHGKVIGKIKIESTSELSYIYGFGLIPEYRGKGYGRESLNLAIELIRKNKIDNIYLDVAASNSKALNLYESCGFERESVMDYYEVQP